MPFGETDRLRQAGDVEQDIFRSGDTRGNTPIDRVDQMAKRARRHEIKTAEVRFSRARDRLKDANRLAISLDPTANCHQIVEDMGNRRLRCCRIARGFVQRDPAKIQGDEYSVRLRLLYFRAGEKACWATWPKGAAMHSSATPWRKAVETSAGQTRSVVALLISPSLNGVSGANESPASRPRAICFASSLSWISSRACDANHCKR